MINFVLSLFSPRSTQDSDSDLDDDLPNIHERKPGKRSSIDSDDDVMVSESSITDDCPLVDAKSPTSPTSPVIKPSSNATSLSKKAKRLSSSGSTGSTVNKSPYARPISSSVIQEVESIPNASPNSSYPFTGLQQAANPPSYLPPLHILPQSNKLSPPQSVMPFSQGLQSQPAYSHQPMSLPTGGFSPYSNPGNSLYGSGYHSDVHMALTPNTPGHPSPSLDNPFAMTAMHQSLPRAGPAQTSFVGQGHLFGDMTRPPTNTAPVVPGDPRALFAIGGAPMM